MDFGNMLSMVIAQRQARYLRIHKNFYVLAPGWLREMADQFLEFFAGHKCKVLDLYYDRAGNAYARQGQDNAGKIKAAIERDADGRPTGWTVNLMSRGQGNLKQDSEYNFMLEFMGGKNRALPQLLVDALNCQEMISSLELARQAVKYKGQTKIVSKVKTSEKLELKKLPRLSTNLSDAFKYLCMRKEWRDAVRPDTQSTGARASVDSWVEAHLGS